MRTFFSFLLTCVCLLNSIASIKPGTWRGALLLNEKESIELPFNFDVKQEGNKTIIVIRNAEEKITIQEISRNDDSLNFLMPVFDSEFRTRNYGDSLVRVWINHARKEQNVIPFKAWFNQSQRFNFKPEPSDNFFNGKWECTFSAGTSDSSKAIGVFKQEGTKASGTFLTETGDYRYLEGVRHQNKLYLSCFDGAHAFLFVAEITNQKDISGHFYSGTHWHEPWVGRRNEKFKLGNPEELTKLKKEFDQLYFSFPDLNGNKVSLSDPKFKNKVVIIQIMGSWCPNCMDETAYLSQFYKQYHNKGLEIIALAYEKASDPERARKNVQRLIQRYNATYTFLITGLSGKDKASESLPALSKISAFPTTIYLDKKGKVRKIYTGFSGPGTGKEYERFKQQHERFIGELLKE